MIEDLGLYDGVHRVFFTMRPGGLWACSMLLFDAVIHLSGGLLHASPPVSEEFSSWSKHFINKNSRFPCKLLVLCDFCKVCFFWSYFEVCL